MATPFFDKLAAETRLQIYEEVLRSNRPLEHIQSIITRKDTRGILRRIRRVHTAILRVNRKANKEALPVFYECNTIVIRHRYLCSADIKPGEFLRFPHCNLGLLRNSVFATDELTSVSPCDCDGRVSDLIRRVSTFALLKCGKIKSITLPLPHYQYHLLDVKHKDRNYMKSLDYQSVLTLGRSPNPQIRLCENLRSCGLVAGCTRVGQIQVTLPTTSFNIMLQDDGMLHAWEYYNRASNRDIELPLLATRAGSMADLVQQLFLAKRSAWSTTDATVLRDKLYQHGYLELDWLNIKKQDEDVLGKVTDGLARWMVHFKG
ncbi:hypothetical protein LTR10_013931 [Elasticomyces elasticus]|nr:hypothetical protein LTR10_013931 [Elasticomyces elasticus]KAK4974487.1 hypothetical protein LTR42_005132 [Elasticomyces elasticus]